MDKRNFIVFLVLSMAVLMLSNQLFPPPPPKPAAGPEADAPVADGAAKLDDDENLADALGQPDDEAAPGVDELVVPDAEEVEVPREFVTLGSLDRERGYRMLVTLTNQGAAVERVELTSPRFRDLQHRSGYPGNLALEATEGGLKVRVVGDGTPAALAGIQVGDVIVGVETKKDTVEPVKTVDEFHAALADTRPDQEVSLRVVRDGGASQSLTVKLMRRPLEVMRPEIENIQIRNGTVPDGFVDPPSFLSGLASCNGKQFPADAAAQLAAWLEQGHSMKGAKAKNLAAAAKLTKWLEQGNWRIIERNGSTVAFERSIPAQNLKLIKRYTLEPVPAGSREDGNYPGYHLKLDVEVENTGAAPQTVAYRLDGPTGLPIEGWWYSHKISRDRWMGGAGLRDVVARFQGQGVTQFDCMVIAEDKAEPMGHDASLAFVGVDAVYFSSVLIPEKKSLDEDWFDITEAIRVGPKPDARTPLTYTNVTCRLLRDPVVLAPGKSQKDSYQVFIGPKRPVLLAEYQAAGDPNYSLRDIIYFGWFGSVARGMLGILHFFYGIVGNYGIAIVMLTVLVRGAMFPISYKQTQNMARMQALKPELDRITEKYKTDMQKRSEAMQELYRKHKINPLGGCLPLVLQLPIFIGLYRAIMIDVELRQSPLFGHWIHWCSDLSAPDMLYDWSWFMPQFINSGEGIFGLGPYFNVLPLVTVALFLVSMKMSMPEPANEQAAMQQKMMKYMTVFMGLLFYKVASGLCLYFIASSLWGLGERRLLNWKKAKDGLPTATAPAPSTRDAARTSANGSPGKKGPKAKRKK